MLAVLFLVGCGGNQFAADTPRKKLAVAEISFTTVLEELNVRKDRGDFSASTLEAIQDVATKGSLLMDLTHQALAIGDDEKVSLNLITILEVLEELERYLLKMEEVNFGKRSFAFSRSYFGIKSCCYNSS